MKVKIKLQTLNKLDFSLVIIPKSMNGVPKKLNFPGHVMYISTVSTFHIHKFEIL